MVSRNEKGSLHPSHEMRYSDSAAVRLERRCAKRPSESDLHFAGKLGWWAFTAIGSVCSSSHEICASEFDGQGCCSGHRSVTPDINLREEDARCGS